jgi:hypothetical protein
VPEDDEVIFQNPNALAPPLNVRLGRKRTCGGGSIFTKAASAPKARLLSLVQLERGAACGAF